MAPALLYRFDTPPLLISTFEPVLRLHELANCHTSNRRLKVVINVLFASFSVFVFHLKLVLKGECL